MGGAKRHLTNLLKTLAVDSRGHSFVVFGRESVLPQSATSLENAAFEFVKFSDAGSGFSLGRLKTDVFDTPRFAKQHACDVIVSLTNNGPIFSPVPHVVFQRNALLFAPEYLADLPRSQQHKMKMQRRLAVETMKRARVIVTPSRSMADLVKTDCPEVAGKQFQVLYHGSSVAALNEPLSEKVAVLFERPGPKLLYPTHGAIHKGFDDLLRLLVELKKQLDFTLYTTLGEESADVLESVRSQAKELGLERNLVFTGQIPQGQMGGLYRRCDAMIYPSLLESFGYSMVEAMGCGLPIVAADTAVNREICGAAAKYYAAIDAVAGARSLLAALEKEENQRLKAEAPAQLSALNCSWDAYRESFLKLIEAVA